LYWVAVSILKICWLCW